MKKRRHRIRLFIIIVLLIFAWYFNNYSLTLSEETVFSDKIGEDIKIAVISDLHGGKFGKDNKQVTARIEQQKPDLIFVLGDMYTQNHSEQIKTAVSLIKNLAAIAKTYVITGDHDTDQEYADRISKLENVSLMNYKKESITVNGNKINIYGIDNVYFSPTFDLHHEFSEPDSTQFNILMAHIPETEALVNFGVDLILSGDTHGGMLRLPFLGSVYYSGYILPKLTYPRSLTDKGLYDLGNKKIFVTSGLGDYPAPVRLFNRPEIGIITIKETSK